MVFQTFCITLTMDVILKEALQMTLRDSINQNRPLLLYVVVQLTPLVQPIATRSAIVETQAIL